MKISCPSCAKSLAVGDDFGGRRVKCPGCQTVFQVPAAEPIEVKLVEEPTETKVSDRPLPGKKSVAPPPLAAVQPGTPAAKAGRRACPECGASLSVNALECSECDWTSDRAKSSGSSRRSVPTKDDEGRCYIFIRKDEVGLNQAIEKRMTKLIDTEQLDMRIVNDGDDPPDELGPNDLVVSGRVDVCEYGSQFVRYFLTFIAMLGPGSCKLVVNAEVETAEDKIRPIPASARQWIGLFGGTGTGLMKSNVQVVATRIANTAARHITGKSFLNLHVYHCAYWSLGLGVASLIPFLGLITGPISIIVGLVALVTISRRDLPRGKIMAIAGLLLSFVGVVVSVGFIALANMR
jgi:phage FluMu protein Com